MNHILATGIVYLFLSCNANTRTMQDGKFPRIEATTLMGKKVVFPDVASGKTALVVVAFRRQAQGVIDSWKEPFLKDFGGNSDYTFYEIPMISSGWKVMAPVIDNGMRSGVPRELHNQVATYYGPLDQYFEFWDIQDKRDAYVFLLDKEGYVLHTDHGTATPEKYHTLKSIAENGQSNSE